MKVHGKSEHSNSIFHMVQVLYYSLMNTIWPIIPAKTLFVAAVIILAGFCLNGNWLIAVIGLSRQLNKNYIPDLSFNILEAYKLKDLPFYLASSLVSSYAMYFPLCGFIQWYFYVNRRDRPEEWKCQPRKFLTWKDERHEIIYGTVMLTLVSLSTGCLSCYINNGGYTTLYYNVSEYGWIYYMLSVPLLYLSTDFLLYCAHRAFHLPFLYKRWHKVHHRYKQPTAFSATAMHPMEFYTYQICTFLPIYVYPIHYSVLLSNLLYMFYYGIMDHSGVKMSSIWPWQPSSQFHDNHHQYFHVNFGMNLSIWDRIFGTARKTHVVYNEDIFFGKGKPFDQATEKEKVQHLYSIKDDY